MCASPDAAAKESEARPASSPGHQAITSASAAAGIDVVRPVVAFWMSRWWLLALMVPALIAAKVLLVLAGVPWWLVAVVAATLFAAKTVLIVRHSRRAGSQGRRLQP